MNVRRAIAAIGTSALLASCTGSGANFFTVNAPSALSVASANANALTVTIRIRISKRPLRARYFSPATKGASMMFSGPVKTKVVVGLSPSDKHCAPSPSTCTVEVRLRAGTYSATIRTYDKAPIRGAIPPAARLLSQAKNMTVKVVLDKRNTIGITLDGVPATLIVGGLPSAKAGTAFSSPQPFSVTAQDAAGDTIVGTYSTPISLSNGDASGATSIATSGADHPPAGELLSSNDVAMLNYNGSTMSPATISAAAKTATRGSAVFRPVGNDYVTLATDADPGTTPGICPGGNNGDLRYELCNAIPGDTIVFDTNAMCGGGVPCTITLAAPLPPIVQNETIDGGSFGNVIIDGAGKYRAFFVDSGVVSIANLQIQNTRAQGGAGGSGYGGGGGGVGIGAGLFVNQAGADVTISNLYFLNNAAAGGAGGALVRSSFVQSGGGGGGMAFDGADGSGGGGGGGGILSAGVGAGAGDSGSGGSGGLGGGGGGGPAPCSNRPGTGGAAYASDANGAGQGGADGLCRFDTQGPGGSGGFGGGGGGNGSKGGFGGGAGGIGSVGNDGAGGPGGSLSPGLPGGNAGGGGGGGVAAGPAIFVNAGSLTTANSGAMGSTATGGAAGSGGRTDGGGSADATPVYNYAGNVNGSSTTGPVPSALSGSAPSLRRRNVPHRSAQMGHASPSLLGR
jgi:hypothetical protein